LKFGLKCLIIVCESTLHTAETSISALTMHRLPINIGKAYSNEGISSIFLVKSYVIK